MSKNLENIPDVIVGRLPHYLRMLYIMQKKGKVSVNSAELGEALGYSPAQVRKDLSQFGEFGKQGTGYNVEYLKLNLQEILKADRNWNILLVGVGKIGNAIMKYSGFAKQRFFVVAAIDDDPEVIGTQIDHCVVQDMSKMKALIEEHDIKIAMLSVPASAAQAIANELVDNGIEGILSYAPVSLILPDDVRVEYIDPILALQHITYYI